MKFFFFRTPSPHKFTYHPVFYKHKDDFEKLSVESKNPFRQKRFFQPEHKKEKPSAMRLLIIFILTILLIYFVFVR